MWCGMKLSTSIALETWCHVISLWKWVTTGMVLFVPMCWALSKAELSDLRFTCIKVKPHAWGSCRLEKIRGACSWLHLTAWAPSCSAGCGSQLLAMFHSCKLSLLGVSPARCVCIILLSWPSVTFIPAFIVVDYFSPLLPQILMMEFLSCLEERHLLSWWFYI